MRRALLIVIAIPLLLILAAVILVPLFLDKEKILDVAAAEINKQTGATLQVKGDVGLSIFPTLGVSLEDVSLDMPAEQQSGLTAQALQIGVQLMPLLSQQIEIETIALDGLVLKTVTKPAPAPLDTSKMSDEQLQAFYNRRRTEMEEAGQASGAEAALVSPLALEVASLSVTDSRLELTELGGATTVVDIVQLKAQGLNLDGRSIPLEAEVRVPGEQVVVAKLKGTISINQATQVLSMEAMELDLTGVLEDEISLSTSGEIHINSQVADLNLVANIGASRAEGQLRYASFESPAIDTQLHLNLFTPALIALAGPDAAQAAEPGEDSAGESTEDDVALPLNAIRNMDTRAALRIDKLVWEGHTVTDITAKLRAVDGAVNLSKVSGSVHGGQLDMKASLYAQHATAKVNTTGSLNGVNIAEALAATEVDPILSGRANLNWKLHGQGNTSNAITQTLRGPIDLQTEDAVLKDMAVEKMLCEAVALVNQESLSAQFPTDSAFEDLSVKIVLGKGEAKLQPLRAQLADIRLLGKGSMDITSMDFDTTFTAKLAPGLEKLDPACRVNERITGIDWPVNCKGNAMGEPDDWCGVDTTEIIEDLASQELKRKATKEVEEKFGKEAGDLLKGFLGK